MLDFYIVTETGEKEGLGGLSLNDVMWLAKFDVIKKGTTGLLADDGAETLPFYDDFELTPEVIERMYNKFKSRYEELSLVPGSNSHSLEKYKSIITVAVEKKRKVWAVSD